MSESTTTDIVIVGAGPAGFTAAIFAARRGKKVIICEQLKRDGAKILVSGGGKCNLTNMLDTQDFIDSFGQGTKFMEPAVWTFFREELIEFLDELGLKTSTYDGFHIFPESNKASQVLKVLKDECARLGVRLFTQCRVDELIIEDGVIAGVRTNHGEINAKAVLVSTGGRSYKKCGGTGGGYPLAKQAGHKITKLLPGMVALRAHEEWCGTLSGVTVPDASFYIDMKRYDWNIKRGSVMFTHKGLTGLRLLDISADVSELLQRFKTVPVRINFCADKTKDDWFDLLADWKENSPLKEIQKLVAFHSSMTQKLAQTLCEELSLVGVKAGKITDEQKELLVDTLTSYTLNMYDTEGFERAMVTRGGIKLKDIDEENLQSKLVNNLYFAGEVLNIDGPCGGFNVQWAFASGHLAGISMLTDDEQ